MRITIAQGAFFPVPPLMGGAVERVWYELGMEFVRCGHAVTQISRAHPQLPAQECLGGVQHLRIPGYDTPTSLLRLKYLDLRYSLRMLQHLPAADVLVTNTFWLPFLIRSSRFGRLYVHVARFPKGQMRLYRHAHRLQGVSQAVADAIVREIPRCRGRVRAIPNPLSAQAFAEPGNRPPQPRAAIGYLGRLHPEKGVHVLVEAFRQARNQGLPESGLLIQGPWRSEQGGGGQIYRARLAELSQGDAGIHLAEPVFDPAHLRSVYGALDLFVYPSMADRGESFGLAPLEAMATGCPALVSALPCFGDFILDGQNGFVFNHRRGNPVAALAEALVRLVRDPATLRDTGRRAYQTAQEFALPRVAQKYIEDFAAVLRG